MVPTLACYFLEESNELFERIVKVPYTSMDVTIRDIAIFFAFVTGVNYNLNNIINGFLAAKDKGYAIGCVMPYVQFFMMMYFSSFSQLYESYPAYFLILCGFYLTWVTAIFNLCSTAGAKFDWIFMEPSLFMGIIYMDVTQIVDAKLAGMLYIGFFLMTMVRYLLLMNNIVNQITSHMGLRFL